MSLERLLCTKKINDGKTENTENEVNIKRVLRIKDEYFFRSKEILVILLISEETRKSYIRSDDINLL